MLGIGDELQARKAKMDSDNVRHAALGVPTNTSPLNNLGTGIDINNALVGTHTSPGASHFFFQAEDGIRD